MPVDRRHRLIGLIGVELKSSGDLLCEYSMIHLIAFV